MGSPLFLKEAKELKELLCKKKKGKKKTKKQTQSKQKKTQFQKSGSFNETQKSHPTTNQSNENVMQQLCFICSKTKIMYKEWKKRLWLSQCTRKVVFHVLWHSLDFFCLGGY